MRKKVVLGALAVLLAGGIFCGLSIARAVRSQAVREIAPEEALFAAFQAAAEAYSPPADDLPDAGAGTCWGTPMLETHVTFWGRQAATVVAPRLTYRFADVPRGGQAQWELQVELVSWSWQDGALQLQEAAGQARFEGGCQLSMQVDAGTALWLHRRADSLSRLGDRFDARISPADCAESEAGLSILLPAEATEQFPIQGSAASPDRQPPQDTPCRAALTLTAAAKPAGFWFRQEIPVAVSLEAAYRSHVSL